jgi:N6-adenosine-specific RNA methylase IME4
MEYLGFRYVTNMAWGKVDNGRIQMGLGQYLRGAHELCLFGVRGRLPAASRSIPSLVLAPRGQHSQKPQEAYDAIEQVTPGPRLEMFARAPRPGWDVWGSEV